MIYTKIGKQIINININIMMNSKIFLTSIGVVTFGYVYSTHLLKERDIKISTIEKERDTELKLIEKEKDTQLKERECQMKEAIAKLKYKWW